MRRFSGLVFDKDGTLFDFHRTWAGWAERLVREIGGGDAARTAALAERLGVDLAAGRFEKTSPMIAGTTEDLVAGVRAVAPEIADDDRLRRFLLMSSAQVALVEAAPLVPLFDRLAAAGFRMGVATNDAEAPARAHLRSAGVLEHMAFVAGYDSGHGAKPDPGMLDAFCRATGLAPSACAMIGDSHHDLASGRAAGMATVAVLTGIAEAAELAPMADVVLPDVGALPAWLGLDAVGAAGDPRA